MDKNEIIDEGKRIAERRGWKYHDVIYVNDDEDGEMLIMANRNGKLTGCTILTDADGNNNVAGEYEEVAKYVKLLNDLEVMRAARIILMDADDTAEEGSEILIAFGR